MNSKYTQRRKEFEKRFRSYQPVPNSEKVMRSPSGMYELTITQYTAGPSTWNYSRGVVRKLGEHQPIADIKRNYGAFWHAWVQHPTGNDYLLCGEDYQGYTVINLTHSRIQTYFPERGYAGFGFCWAQVFPSPDGLMLAVDGCYWACTYELVFYDFRTPEVLPLPELQRVDGLDEATGWKDNDIFLLTREIEIRQSDGVPYDSLSQAEQEVLDNDETLTDYTRECLEVTRPPVETHESSGS